MSRSERHQYAWRVVYAKLPPDKPKQLKAALQAAHEWMDRLGMFDFYARVRHVNNHKMLTLNSLAIECDAAGIVRRDKAATPVVALELTTDAKSAVAIDMNRIYREFSMSLRDQERDLDCFTNLVMQHLAAHRALVLVDEGVGENCTPPDDLLALVQTTYDQLV